MAANAADPGFKVRRALEVRMRAYVTTEASGINLFGGSFAQLQDLGDIPTGGHVRGAGPMAALTGRPSPAMHQR
jgi:hypothetical protein